MKSIPVVAGLGWKGVPLDEIEQDGQSYEPVLVQGGAKVN